MTSTSAEQTEAIKKSMQDEKAAQPVAWQYRYSFGDGLYSAWATSETRPNLDDDWECRPVYLHPSPAQDEKATKDEVIRELVDALRPFAEAWAVATHHKQVVEKCTLGQLGELAAHEVFGVHYRNADLALRKAGAL